MLIPCHKLAYYKEFHSLFLNFSHIVTVTFLATPENWIVFPVFLVILHVEFMNLFGIFE